MNALYVTFKSEWVNVTTLYILIIFISTYFFISIYTTCSKQQNK